MVYRKKYSDKRKLGSEAVRPLLSSHRTTEETYCAVGWDMGSTLYTNHSLLDICFQKV